MTELNDSDGSVVQSIPAGSLPGAVSTDGSHVWVANFGDNTVMELNESDGSLVRTIGVANGPNGAQIGGVIASDGTHVWVANYVGNTVAELNTSDGSVIGTIGVGNCPTYVSLGEGSGGAWVTNACDNTVSRISLNFGIVISSLPAATPGTAYGPVTLQAVNLGTSAGPYITKLKWKKVTLPKGLKLSSAGVLSGTLNKKLAAGPSSITVEVTEKVTTLNGKKKVKTATTAQATIPLTIN